MDDVTRRERLAAELDQQGRAEEALHFYGSAGERLLLMIIEGKAPATRMSTVEECLGRAEQLKKELGVKKKLREIELSTDQLEAERAEFLCWQADDTENREEALKLYTEAVEIGLSVTRSASLSSVIRSKLSILLNKALTSAERLKNEEQKVATAAGPSTSAVQNDIFDFEEEDLSELRLDDQAPRGIGPSNTGAQVARPVESPKKNEALSKFELEVLAATSRINGRCYVPFLAATDADERFQFLEPWSDPDGLLALADKQRKRLGGWRRLADLDANPAIIKCIDSGTIKQTVVSDCSFVSSLAVAARYERRFGRQLVTSIIYPQNRTTGAPVYNESGKYMLRMHINGIWRKIIIDDRLPVDTDGRLLCSHSRQKGEAWVSLLEKAYLKVMGGYDFPGSNSNIDLHALTGWIPERIALKSESRPKDLDAVFEKLLAKLHTGDCLVTLATGKLSEEDEKRTGLVEAHAYAVLDVRKVNGHRLLMVKNPWTHLRWRGRWSERDTTSWTPEMRKALDYDPDRAKEVDDGVFWIDYPSVLNFFDVFYVNWNPKLFPFSYGLHSCWNSTAGPVKDLYTVGDNPQYRLVVKNSGNHPAAVWILLTRHITDKQDFAENREYITVMVYKGGKKVYIPFDPPPLYEGVRINSPHYLCQMLVPPDPTGAPSAFTLIVAQYEKTATIFYTLRVYASADFTLAPIKTPFTVKKRETGEWRAKTAGGSGSGTSRATYENNPLYELSLADDSDDHAVHIELRGPRQYSVGIAMTVQKTTRESKKASFGNYGRRDSGAYRPGFCYLSLEGGVPAGTYHIRPATFQAAQEGAFLLDVACSGRFTLTRIQ